MNTHAAQVSSRELSSPETGRYTSALVTVTTLFFMWGFLTALNDILVPHLKSIFELSYAEVMLIQFSFFSAYFVFSIPSGMLIQRTGYKKAMVIGLALMGLGAAMFVPAARVPSFPLFLAALIVLATGITLLQVAANPYVTVLGPARTSSSRLNLTQAFNSLGTTVAPYVGSLLILSAAAKPAVELHAMSPAALHAYRLQQASSVKWPYLGLTLTLILLAVVIAAAKLPSIPHAVRGKSSRDTGDSVWRHRHLVLGAIAIFTYVGAEVAIGSFLVLYFGVPSIGGLAPDRAARLVSVYWLCAMVGRFIGAWVLRYVPTGIVLAFNAIAACVLVVVSMVSSGPIAVASILLVGLFNSIMFPSIFSLGVAELGPLTGDGSGVLIMAVVGGAIIPVLEGVLADHIGIQLAFLLPAFCYLYILYYALKGLSAHSGGPRVRVRNSIGGTMQVRTCETVFSTLKRSVTFACSLLAVLLVGVTQPARSGSAQSVDDNRADAILAKISLEQEIDYIGGVDGFYIRALPGLGVPALRMADGPMGVRNSGPATAMAAGINLAATWDTDLAQRVGMQIGRDARAKGVNFLLGPGLNIYRSPLNGRNFEYFGEDPFLASRIAVGYVNGVQSQGVSATAKHFMGNNSEFDRHNTDSVIDGRTMREIYLPAFEAVVKDAHVGAIMNSYNLVNGVHATQNEILNTQVLKREWGFQGVLVSDWFATYDGVAAARSGLDLEMPAGAFMNRNSLLPALNDGRVSQAQLDDKVRRILLLAVRFHWLDRDQTDPAIPRYNLEGRRTALEAAREGAVLLKNDSAALPLDKRAINSVAVIGPGAYPGNPVGGGSAGVRPFATVSILEGIANELGSSVRTTYSRGIPDLSQLAAATNFSTAASGGDPGTSAEYFSNTNLDGDPLLKRNDAHINFGASPNADLGAPAASYPSGVGSARWTGYYTAASAAPYDFFVESTGEAGGYYRVSVDDKPVLDSWKEARALVGLATPTLDAGPHKIVVEHRGMPGFLGARFRFGIVRQDSYVDRGAEKLAAAADAVIVAVGFDPQSESEASDRTFRLPPGQDQLIERIAALNKRTIVVVASGGAVDVTPWIDRVPALLESWYAGQEGGTAIANILFGDVSPSGRLPISWDRRWEDNPAHDSYYPAPGTSRVEYKEGIFTGYRGYERSTAKPLFPFGFGLSYTTFAYKNLAVHPLAVSSGKPSLSYEVSFDVTNTGHREGADVAQVYVGELHPTVPRPERELKGFARVDLRPGATQRVKIILNGRAFAYFDTVAHVWRVDPGEFTISVGRAVDQIQLRRMVSLTPSTAARNDGKP